MCLWLKEGKYTLGYGVTNILFNHRTVCMGKFYKGNIILGQIQNVVCLVIKKKQGKPINTEHQKYELCINFIKKYGWISKKIAKALQYEFWNYYTLIPDMKENRMESLTGRHTHKKEN